MARLSRKSLLRYNRYHVLDVNFISQSSKMMVLSFRHEKPIRTAMFCPFLFYSPSNLFYYHQTSFYDVILALLHCSTAPLNISNQSAFQLGSACLLIWQSFRLPIPVHFSFFYGFFPSFFPVIFIYVYFSNSSFFLKWQLNKMLF